MAVGLKKRFHLPFSGKKIVALVTTTMLTQTQVRCLGKYANFSGKKVLVVGRLSSQASDALREMGALVNDLRPDIVIYWGLLTGTSAEVHLEYAAQKCSCLIVETDVLDTSQNLCTKTLARMKPSAAYIESILARQGFSGDMIVDGDLNVDDVSYDWPVQETWECVSHKRRVWVFERVQKEEKEEFS